MVRVFLIQINSLTKHRLLSHSSSYCGKAFASLYNMQEHEKRHKNKNEVITSDGILQRCPKCSKGYRKGGKKFDLHVMRCNGCHNEKRQYSYPCSHCGKSFVTKIACAAHMAESHNFVIENVEKFCFICMAEFDEIIPHMRQRHCNFACPLCGQRFTNEEKMNRHVATKHDPNGEERTFACDECDLKFKSSNHLRSHKAIHASNDEKPFTCEICSKRFSFRFVLNSHIKQAHNKSERFACPFCDRKFKALNIMKHHAEREHGEDCVYLCTTCPEKFKTRNELRNHEKLTHGSR
jgi:KRAB domain-containing zinc finger protein